MNAYARRYGHKTWELFAASQMGQAMLNRGRPCDEGVKAIHKAVAHYKATGNVTDAVFAATESYYGEWLSSHTLNSARACARRIKRALH